MDPVLLGVIIIFILVFVLVPVFLFFSKEQSFEEAVALQKANNEPLYQSKNPVEKTLKHRKKSKKEKSRSEEESGRGKFRKEGDVSTLPVVESAVTEQDVATLFSESSPERANGITESSEDEKPAPKAHKKRSKEKGKSGRSPVVERPRKEQEQAKKIVVEEMVVQEVFQKSEAEPAFESEVPMIPEVVVVPEQEHPVQATPSTAATSKKAKKSKGSKDKNLNADSSNFQSLIDNLDNLNDNEVQKLVDILLDKQKVADQWKISGGKPDPIDTLKKQLSEKEAAYVEEHSRADNLAAKTKEIRDELLQEKTKQKKAENTASQRIKTLEKENEAVLNRMRANQENHIRESESLNKAVEHCQQSHGQLDWHKLQEELLATKEHLQHAEDNKANLEARVSTLENEANQKVESDSVLMKQATEANANYEALKHSLSTQLKETVKAKAESEQRLEIAKKDVKAAHTEKAGALQNAGVLQTQLDDEKSKKAELEKMFKASDTKLKETEKSLKDKEVHVRKLESASETKNNTQMAELKKQHDTTSRQLEELKAKHSQAEQEHGETKQALTGKEEQLSKHEGEIHSLRSSNTSKDGEIEVLKQRVSERVSEMEVIKNNVAEDLQATPDEDEGKVKSLEEDLEKLKTELNEKNENVATMEQNLEMMKAKNNELRNKNWKAMDAISTTEKQHKVELGKAMAATEEENKTTLEKYNSDVKVYLCKIHPSVTINQDLPYDQFLNEYENKSKELGCESQELIVDNTKADELETELKESLKKNEELSAQCNKYKVTLSETENMLHDLEKNVEKEIANLKETLQRKEAELKETNTSLNGLKEDVRKAEEASTSKDNKIATMEEELSKLHASAASADDTSKDELKKLSDQLQHSMEQEKVLRSEIEAANKLKETLQNKESELKKMALSVNALKENVRKAEEGSKSKDSKISSLQGDVSTLQGSAKSFAESSKKELAKLSKELESTKEQGKDLAAQLEAAKKENSSPELDKYKSEASDAATVNAELRKELEEVRIEYGDLKASDTPSKKDEGKGKAAKKESEEKVRALEEKLALAAKNENELHAKIASLEDSKSTTSIDEDSASTPDHKKKKGIKGFLGSSKSKYESKYKDMSEKYEHAKTESDEKSSRISELESKLKESEKALEANDGKVKELSDSLKKAQENGLINGGVQSTASKPLNESQMKQMAEAMKDGENPASGGV